MLSGAIVNQPQLFQMQKCSASKRSVADVRNCFINFMPNDQTCKFYRFLLFSGILSVFITVLMEALTLHLINLAKYNKYPCTKFMMQSLFAVKVHFIKYVVNNKCPIQQFRKLTNSLNIFRFHRTRCSVTNICSS